MTSFTRVSTSRMLASAFPMRFIAERRWESVASCSRVRGWVLWPAASGAFSSAASRAWKTSASPSSTTMNDVISGCSGTRLRACISAVSSSRTRLKVVRPTPNDWPGRRTISLVRRAPSRVVPLVLFRSFRATTLPWRLTRAWWRLTRSSFRTTAQSTSRPMRISAVRRSFWGGAPGVFCTRR
jgi:hypothetical protein